MESQEAENFRLHASSEHAEIDDGDSDRLCDIISVAYRFRNNLLCVDWGDTFNSLRSCELFFYTAFV